MRMRIRLHTLLTFGLMQVVGMVKKYKGYGYLNSIFHSGHRGKWTAMLKNGQTTTIVSEIGTDANGNRFRYAPICVCHAPCLCLRMLCSIFFMA